MAKVTLAGARISAGYTQEELAKKLGVTRNTVNKWESGKIRLTTTNLFAFCLVTGFDPADILLPTESAKRELEVN